MAAKTSSVTLRNMLISVKMVHPIFFFTKDADTDTYAIIENLKKKQTNKQKNKNEGVIFLRVRAF